MTRLLAIIILLVGLAGGGRAEGIGHEFLPPTSWIYPALERFEALGLCVLPSERPLGRDEVRDLVSEIAAAISREGMELSARDLYNMRRLEKEFTASEGTNNPKRRYDPPLLFASDPPMHLEGDLSLEPRSKQDPYASETEFFLNGTPQVRFHPSSSLTYEVSYRLEFGPEHGERARNRKPSTREKSFKGLTALFERSYVNYHRQHVDLYFGRDYEDWGPSESGNLLISSRAQSLDRLGVRVRFLGLTLSAIHSLLSLERKRYLSAHRLSFERGSIVLGVSESVVYAGRGPDPVYLFPLASFYSNQFNERGNDNVLWALDAKFRPRSSVVLYGNLLVDDFQFERGEGTPDKLAFDLGTRCAFGGKLPLSLSLRYRFIDIYTYTHADSDAAYASGAGIPSRGDPLLGGVEGPDSDTWRVSLSVFPREDLRVTLAGLRSRSGEGNDFREFHMGDDPDPKFPSGIVETRTSAQLSLTWELEGNSSVSLCGEWGRIENKEHQAGVKDETLAFDAVVVWDL